METIMKFTVKSVVIWVLTVPMRNGNMNSFVVADPGCSFLPYLWGMETWCVWSNLPGIKGSYRTYEEWKPGVGWIRKIRSFSSYRTYEEWKRLVNEHNTITQLFRSYRTYEEWKLHFLRLRGRRIFKVLTVPMRNGNNIDKTERFNKTSVLTVPMRNGNRRPRIGVYFLIEFLPYLWGMETKDHRKTVFTNVSSYRTYEEWKRNAFEHIFFDDEGFLPYLWGMETHNHNGRAKRIEKFLPYLWGMETCTVARWFLCVDPFLPYLWGMETSCSCYVTTQLLISSYRTYEEWKLFTTSISQWTPNRFLPYLWGMETFHNLLVLSKLYRSYRTYEEWKHGENELLTWKLLWVLTVPMRNGNPHRWKQYHHATFSFLPYLWGMETQQKQSRKHRTQSSYRTYEEWKRIYTTQFCIQITRSYRTYEEWKPSLIWIKLNRFLRSYRTYEEWKQKTDWEILR